MQIIRRCKSLRLEAQIDDPTPSSGDWSHILMLHLLLDGLQLHFWPEISAEALVEISDIQFSQIFPTFIFASTSKIHARVEDALRVVHMSFQHVL
jgi:hypothetical protein